MTVRFRRLGAIVAAGALAFALSATVGASPGIDLVQGIPQRGTVIGQKTANLTLIQFEDLACSHCNDYENQAKLNELATDRGVRRLARGIPGLNANKLILDAKSLSVRRQAAAHAVEADRRKVPGTPWFFIKIGTDTPKLVRPSAYSGEAFAALLDEALGG